jgi:chromosome segregation ATPase
MDPNARANITNGQIVQLRDEIADELSKLTDNINDGLRGLGRRLTDLENQKDEKKGEKNRFDDIENAFTMMADLVAKESDANSKAFGTLTAAVNGLTARVDTHEKRLTQAEQIQQNHAKVMEEFNVELNQVESKAKKAMEKADAAYKKAKKASHHEATVSGGGYGGYGINPLTLMSLFAAGGCVGGLNISK